MNVDALIAEISRRLSAARLHFGHGTHNAAEEAGWIVANAMRLPPHALSKHFRRPVSATAARRARALLARRIQSRAPLAYLLREAWLGGLRFYVDRRVIVPRSYIAELLACGLAPWLRRPPRRVLDLCTGSGCLAILAARAFPAAQVDAADISPGALAVAARNIRRFRLQGRVRLVRSDLLAALGGARYDLILCNPPYVSTRVMHALPKEYRHEPALALAGGASGLDIVHRVIGAARAHLAGGGMLVCEVGGARLAVERAYPRMAFAWPDSSEPGTVFLVEREQLPLSGNARTGADARTKPKRAAAKR